MTTRATSLTLAILGAACGQPEVTVSVTIPAAYADDVATVTLQVLTPGADAAFTCDELAFGEVGADTVSGSRRAYITLTKGAATPLTGVPRLGRKLFWAQGMDASGEMVVAACVEQDSADGGISVDLTAEPATILNLHWIGGLQGGLTIALGDPSARLTALLTDSHNERLAGSRIAWRLVSAGGDLQEGEVLTGDSGAELGIATLQPPTPRLVGPALVSINGRWQRNAKQPIPGMLAPPPPPPTSGEFVGMVGFPVVGRLGPQGRPALALPIFDTVRLLYLDPDGRTLVGQTLPVGGPIQGAAVVPAEPTDKLVVVTASAWLQIDYAGAIAQPRPPIGEVKQFFWQSSCTAARTDGALCAVTANASPPRCLALDAAAEAATSAIAGRVMLGTVVTSAGCIGAVNGDTYPAFVSIQQPANGPLFVTTLTVAAEQPSPGAWSYYVADLQTPPFAAVLTPALAATRPLLITMLDRPDVKTVMQSRVLTLQPDAAIATAQLTSTAVATFPSEPLAVAVGDLDADGEVDVVSTHLGGDPQSAERPLFLLMTLAVSHLGSRAAGDLEVGGREDSVGTPLPRFANGRAYLADFNQDGYDDIALHTFRDETDGTRTNLVRMLLMGVPET
ncbi:MAG: hypothetical protein HY903_13115 [Deltaproteobacteria bacterium]|nr:hypothetical protein [Deltaproteobacteria bacterium]